MAFALKSPAAYFPFKPLWSERPRLARRTYTHIMKSLKSPHEQRSAFQTRILRRLGYRVQTQNTKIAGEISRRLRRYQHEVWGVPIWMYEMRLTSAAKVGASSLHVGGDGLDSSLWSYREMYEWDGGPAIDYTQATRGDRLMLFNGYASTEVVVMSLVGPTGEIVLADGVTLTQAWPAGTKVYPVLVASLAQAATVNPALIRPGYFEVDVEFLESLRADEDGS